MMRWKTIFVGIALSILAQSAFSQFTVEADTKSILIGQPIAITLFLENDTADQVVWPSFNTGDLLGEKAEILNIQKPDTQIKSSSRLIQQTLNITSFDSGVWAVPPFKAFLNGDSVVTEAFVFSVNTVKVDTSESLKPIKDPFEFPMTLEEWVQKYWWVAALVIWAIVVVFLIVRQLKKKPTPVQTKVVEPHIEPLKWFEDQLNEIESQSLWQQGQYKQYHVALSEAVREFLERQYRIPAPESTTDEIKILIQRIDLPEDLKRELIEALKISDLVKFARTTPLADENEYCLRTAKNMVEKVREQEALKQTKSEQS